MIRYCVYSVSQTWARKYRGCFVSRSRDDYRRLDAMAWAKLMQLTWASQGFVMWEIQEDRR